MTHPFQPHSPFPGPSLAAAWAVEILSVSISLPTLGGMQRFLVTPEASQSSDVFYLYFIR